MQVMMLRSWLFAAVLMTAVLSCFTANAASTPAQELEPVTGNPILTITGLIANANMGGEAVFDNALLDTLPQHTITTHTPWHTETKTYEGPLLKDVLAKVKASGKSLTITALNDYASVLPVEDLEKYDVILARKADGETLHVRDKGPLFVMYPFDQHPNLKRKSYYTRCVWQVKSINVE